VVRRATLPGALLSAPPLDYGAGLECARRRECCGRAVDYGRRAVVFAAPPD